MIEKACTKCKRITSEDQCPVCKAPTSENWSGLLIVIDPNKSRMAKELNINLPGEYALRVR
ncbi:DNA-directed RNA polymerase, subunit E'' [Methanothermus fervidus DSM 2088]|uniref:Transcription elongation factor Spt4 n=1 Tax=Methanothermus fervidus (strain ATCC 43054 / DSM 2088 / JCM 10308 / V24 S) TaxID=523846 RepID=E3GY59_METFV|nr:transcription elongation factor subunit Spt4 [Methanothermus fervidus]ADP77241.1 DNA-directed RNA polymerase, subunit E'' [Methanothermus fervidus DSM 2088]